MIITSQYSQNLSLTITNVAFTFSVFNCLYSAPLYKQCRLTCRLCKNNSFFKKGKPILISAVQKVQSAIQWVNRYLVDNTWFPQHLCAGW